MTLVELMISTALLVGGGGALLVGMHYAVAHSDYLSDFQMAMDSAQGRLEEMASTSFDTLLTGAEYIPARTDQGLCRGLGEDRNCNGQLDGGEDLNGNNQLDEPLPGARLNILIKNLAGSPPHGVESILNLYVSACWTTRSRRIGEDQNCNGFLDAGEDLNGNGWLDSPALASTRVARRN